MVALDDRQLAVRADRLAEVAEDGRGQLRDVALGPVAQLDAVAEDHEPVGLAHRLDQRLPQLRPAEEVRMLGRADMQVGDDDRPHGTRVAADDAVGRDPVADFSRVLAGPYATMLLGDLGADVVKVERPDGGDDTRAWGPPWHGDASTYYLTINRNKRSVALDLTDEGDRELARARAARRRARGVLPARPDGGLGPRRRRAREGGNRGLVSCSVTAFGTGEAGRALPGYDFLLQAMGGLMHVTGELDGPPLKVGAAVVDLICGLIAANGIQAALLERARTGRGRHVEVSLMDSALASLLNQASAWVAGGVAGTRRGNRHPSIVPYETYDAADRPIAIAVGTTGCSGACAPRSGTSSWPATSASRPTPRVEHRDELSRLLGAAIAREDAAHWVKVLREAAVPVGPINGIDEAFALRGRARHGADRVRDGVPLVRPPLRVDGERPEIRRARPRRRARRRDPGLAARGALNDSSRPRRRLMVLSADGAQNLSRLHRAGALPLIGPRRPRRAPCCAGA